MRRALSLGACILLAGCMDIGSSGFGFECPVPERGHFLAGQPVRCNVYGDAPRGEPRWDFGDGTTARGDVVEHVFPAGSHVVTASWGPYRSTHRVAVASLVEREGVAPVGGVPLVGEPQQWEETPFEVGEDAAPIVVRVEAAGAQPVRLGVDLVDAAGERYGGARAVTPIELAHTEPLPPGTYTLRVWSEPGPGALPAAEAAYRASVLVPYAGDFGSTWRTPEGRSA